MLLCCGSFAQKNLRDHISRIPLSTLCSVDQDPNDTFENPQHDFIEISRTNGTNKSVYSQARAFESKGHNVTFIVNALHMDQQCFSYQPYFFEYSAKTDSIKAINQDSILPDLNLSLFLKNSASPGIISANLDAIKKNYLGNEATLNQALSEFYSPYFMISKENSTIKVTLQVCDYILSNVGDLDISEAEEKIILTDFKTFDLIWDKNKKRFILKQ
jgi:hypothetical protein